MKKVPIRHIVEPALRGNFSIQQIEALLGEKDMIQPLHRHSFFFILVLKKGTGEHQIDFTPYPVSDTSVFFMRPGQVHQLTLRSGSTGYLLKFSPDFYTPPNTAASEVFRSVSNKHYCPVKTESFNKLSVILQSMLDEYNNKQEQFEHVIQSHLHIFFIELLRQSRNPKQSAGSGNDQLQERLEIFTELITNHVIEHKQVSYYANQLHLTPYQLNAITKATLDKTASEVINDYIILEAKRHLLATTEQINQIAWHLGYEDVSYFTRFFKKRTGQTPEAFRNNSR